MNLLSYSVILGLFIGTSADSLYYKDGSPAFTCSPGNTPQVIPGKWIRPSGGSVSTTFSFKTDTSINQDINLVLYQLPETPTPGIDTDAVAWRTIPVQGTGGGVIVDVSFDVSIQASITTDEGDVLLSKMLPAINGQVFAITQGSMGGIELNSDGTDTAGEAGKNIIKVNNNYETTGKPPVIQVSCYKNSEKLVQMDALFDGSNVQFQIYPILYAAYSTDLQQGETFKAGTYSDKAQALYFLSPQNKAQPASYVDVLLSLGTDGALHWSYTVDGFDPLPLPVSAGQLSTIRGTIPVPNLMNCTGKCLAMKTMHNAVMWMMTCRKHKSCWYHKVDVALTNCMSNCTNPTSLGLSSKAPCKRAGCKQSVPEFKCDRATWPNVCQNAANGITNGHPSCLVRGDPAYKKARRDAACGAFKKTNPIKPASTNCEEYPFASTSDGGVGAQCSYVPINENTDQGQALNTFYQQNKLNTNDCFVVTVI